jgi:aldehyde dehydrogenase (NAD+)
MLKHAVACNASSRIYVQEGIYDRFLEAFSNIANARKLGNQFDPETQQGLSFDSQHFDCCSVSFKDRKSLKYSWMWALWLSTLIRLLTPFERVLGYIDAGKKDGATVYTGGQQYGKEGFFIQPTIFTDAKPGMSIVDEEIFGPVAVVIKFKTDAGSSLVQPPSVPQFWCRTPEGIEMANNTKYGLASGVFSQNINRALNVANSLEAGTVFVRLAFCTSCSM